MLLITDILNLKKDKMPDISMCANNNCTLSSKCYRFTATPNPWRQTYAKFAQDENGECNYFWDNKK